MILETSQNAAAALFHTVHVHSYRYSHEISILLGLGTPLIVPLLCAFSPLSSQGAKTRTPDMANSAAIGTFHKNDRLAYSRFYGTVRSPACKLPEFYLR